MKDDQVVIEPTQEEIEVVKGNGTVATVTGDQAKVTLDDVLRNVYDMKNEYLPVKQTSMSDLYDEWVDAPVRLHDGRTGVVCGVDPRPRHAIDDKQTKPGNWLYIRLDKVGSDGKPVVFEQAENVRRMD